MQAQENLDNSNTVSLVPPFPDSASVAGLQIIAGTTRVHRVLPSLPTVAEEEVTNDDGLENKKESSFIDEVPEDLATEAELTWSSLMAEIETANWHV